MPSIAIAIIAHNEEKNLPRALKSAAWADEVILVDCGSTDNTAAAAKEYKVRFFSRPNSTAVYVNKQFAIDQAVSDWVLVLDADEEIPPGLRQEIKEVVFSRTAAAAFKMPRRNFWLMA
jgi:glycosyltransferase involved in cell wall biosynthesis